MGDGLRNERIEEVLDLPRRVTNAIRVEGGCVTVGDLLAAMKTQSPRKWHGVGAKGYGQILDVVCVLNNAEGV